MLQGWIGGLQWDDALALLWFLGCWAGYGWLAERGPRAARGLIGATHQHRVAWARALLQRENRVVDAALVGNLMGSVSFYASTTIYIIAGLLALMGTVDKVMVFAANLPFAHASSRGWWQIRLLLMLVVFVFAYFKFTWSMRQFNFLCILMGAAPQPVQDTATLESEAEQMARINSYAGDEFNRGIRAYYFGLAAASWFIQPWLVVGLCTLVVWILYRRDFASPALWALRGQA
ncbi:DUF599 domain-containing protein [Leeia sp.]|uniref:DUF599 domain-containing protein n=1 Tax=Leeia sp. TaxID=2884678 RepID=UPI0035B405F6